MFFQVKFLFLLQIDKQNEKIMGTLIRICCEKDKKNV